MPKAETEERTKSSPLVEQVRPAGTKIYDLRTPITILLESGALCTVIRVRNTWIIGLFRHNFGNTVNEQYLESRR